MLETNRSSQLLVKTQSGEELMEIDFFFGRILDRVRIIAESRFWTLLLSCFLGFTALTGVQMSPNREWAQAAHPFEPNAAADAVYSSPIMPIIGHYVGATSRLSYAILAMGIILAAFAWLAHLARKNYGSFTAFVFFLFVLLHPVTITLLSTLGKSDAITFFLSVSLLFDRRPLFVMGLCAAAAFNHEMSLFMIPCLIALRIAAGEFQAPKQVLLLTVLGLIAGRLLNVYFLNRFGIQVGTSRFSEPLQRGLLFWLSQNLRYSGLMLYSFHGFGWFFLVGYIAQYRRTHRPYLICLILSQCLFLCVTFFVRDSTRIFTMMGWPMLAHAFLFFLAPKVREFRPPPTPRSLLITFAFIVGLFTPSYYIFLGQIYGKPFTMFWGGLCWNLLGKIY